MAQDNRLVEVIDWRRLKATVRIARAALFVALFVCMYMHVAWAEESLTQSSPVTDAEPSELQLRIEQTAQAYNDSAERVAELEAQAQECRDRISQIEEELPAARESACDSMRSHYKYTQGRGELIDIILSADDFSSFISMLAYLNGVEEYHAERIGSYVALEEELLAQQEELDYALHEAVEEREIAQAALAEARQVRLEAQRAAEELAAREQSELALHPADDVEPLPAIDIIEVDNQGSVVVEEAQVPDAHSDTTPQDQTQLEDSSDEWYEESPQEDPYEEPYIEEYYEEPASEDVGWVSDRDAFIAEWGARIDAYLGGSPLGGHGYTFAAAAWDYGVDPRWSPAISCIESGKGSVCFLPYNAWGWGSVSWGSWDEAIYAHVAGLARGYGYTISMEAAQRYCPPTWDAWYYGVLAQMEMI